MTYAQLKELELIERLGKKTRKEVIEVTSDGSTFSIVDAYTKVLVDRGLNYGSMAGDYPRALSFKAEYIAKWTNISWREYCKLDGVVLCEDNRDGNKAYIVLFD
jgi:hypothetical protein